MRAARVTALLMLGALLSVDPAVGQAGRGGCTLVMQPTGQTESVSLRTGGDEDAYVTHVWGGMRWTCGTATMTADSAVRYDLERRVEMFGTVRYRDTIRTLESDRLDFFEDDDRMVATGDVLLTRLESGSTLRGPRVSFLRAVSGISERTTASGRPHMILLPKPGEEGKPVDIDADKVDMFGERIAWAWGDVVIQRPDVNAEADSAFFDMDAGSGILFGSARARQEDLDLAGDSIRLSFTEDELEEVRALGNGRALGEEFELLSAEIRARLEQNELEEVWAYGSGRSLAASGSYVLGADSLRIEATAGRLDSIFAVGLGSAVEVEDPDLSAGEPPRTTDGNNWVVGDTLIIVFAEEAAAGVDGTDETAGGEIVTEPPAPAAGEPAVSPPEEGPVQAPTGSAGEQSIEWLLAIGGARSLYMVQPESGEGGEPSRSYLIGERIQVQFDEGKAQRVSADRAIGVFLEPEEGGAAFPGPADETPTKTAEITNPSATWVM